MLLPKTTTNVNSNWHYVVLNYKFALIAQVSTTEKVILVSCGDLRCLIYFFQIHHLHNLVLGFLKPYE